MIENRYAQKTETGQKTQVAGLQINEFGLYARIIRYLAPDYQTHLVSS